MKRKFVSSVVESPPVTVISKASRKAKAGEYFIGAWPRRPAPSLGLLSLWLLNTCYHGTQGLCNIHLQLFTLSTFPQVPIYSSTVCTFFHHTNDVFLIVAAFIIAIEFPEFLLLLHDSFFHDFVVKSKPTYDYLVLVLLLFFYLQYLLYVLVLLIGCLPLSLPFLFFNTSTSIKLDWVE